MPFVRWRNGEGIEGTPSRGIITSHGCTCEDYERAIEAGKSSAASRVLLQVAPLQSASVFDETKQREIQNGERLDLFFVYGDGSKLKDQVADLTREQPIPAGVLTTCKKVARLADWQWNALLVHIAVSRFHVKPEKLFHPELLRESADGA